MTVNLSDKTSEFNHIVAGFVKIPFLCLKLDWNRNRIIFKDPPVVNTMLKSVLAGALLEASNDNLTYGDT